MQCKLFYFGSLNFYEMAMVKPLGPVCDSELNKRIQALIDGDEEAYNRMAAEYLANLTQRQNGNDNLRLDKLNIRKDLKNKALIQHTILYGELEIIRLSASFEILWLFSARDIFVDPDGASAFSMDADGIHLLDWLGWHYHISYDGKLIREYTQQKPTPLKMK